MSDAQLTIRPLIAQDIPQVVEIFCEQFPDLSWTRPGRSFVRKFINWHVEYHPELGLVADENGRLIGFIVGANGGHREYYRQVLRYAFPEFLWGSLLHPWLFFRTSFLTLWQEYFRGLRTARINPKEIGVSKTGEKKGIVCFVAVTGAVQRHGTGMTLMQSFEEAATRAGIQLLSSYTEINNQAARRLHEKQGWKQVREDARRKMVYFSKRLEQDS